MATMWNIETERYEDVDTTGSWVDVASITGDDYAAMVEDIGDNDGPDGMAEYLQQWDYGQETDDAHTGDFGPGTDARLYLLPNGEVLSVNYGLGYASLNRRPIRFDAVRHNNLRLAFTNSGGPSGSMSDLLRVDDNDDVVIDYGFNSGGYENSVYFVTADGEVLGIDTVISEISSVDFTDAADPQWFIVGYGVNYEDGALVDSHTGNLIPAVYV